MPSDAPGAEPAGRHARRPRLSEADLSSISARHAMESVGRDAVWPVPDWRAMADAGAEPEAVALVRITRDRIPLRPPYGVPQSTVRGGSAVRPEGLVRRDYVRMLSIVRGRLMACRTVGEVQDARTAILADAVAAGAGAAGREQLVTSVWRHGQDTLQVDYRDMASARQIAATGWPCGTQPSWQRGYVVRGDSETGFLLARGTAVAADGFASEAAAWEWLRAVAGNRAAPKEAVPTRPRLRNPVREGLAPRRGGCPATVPWLVGEFGLRSLEFGRWVYAAERQALADAAFDALHDLAQALGLPPASIGLDGSLSLTFGVRTAGGGYDPLLRTIAMPRTPSGELAASWARAFDHWSGEAGLLKPVFAPRAATGTARRNGAPGLDLANLSGTEAAAWGSMSSVLWRADPAAASEADRLAAELQRHEAEVEEAERQRRAWLERNPVTARGADAAGYLSRIDRWLLGRHTEVLPRLRHDLAAAVRCDVTAGETSFAREARRLSVRGGGYWTRPAGMFARALECAVNDSLAEDGGHNQFLVHGVEEGRYAEGFRGDPYPGGQERRAAAAAVLAVVAAMAPRLAAGQEPMAQDGPRPRSR